MMPHARCAAKFFVHSMAIFFANVKISFSHKAARAPCSIDAYYRQLKLAHVERARFADASEEEL
jgi:hypothetical protein